MSGVVQNIASGAVSTFASLLQQAYWRGIPFLVDSQAVEKGRQTATHEYPFRDGGWVEDMGRKQREFHFTGHLIGDLAPVMQLALDAACEIPGPGLLIHPTLGAMNVALMSARSSVHKDQMRVILIEFHFREQGKSLFPKVVTDTINKVVGDVSGAVADIGEDLAKASIVLAAASGVVAIVEGAMVASSFFDKVAVAAADPAALVALATALPPPDVDTSYGRYAYGSALTPLPDGSTVASLQAQAAMQRTAITTAAALATGTANAFSADTAQDLASAISATVEAARVTMNNPADQIRVLAGLSTFSYTDTFSGGGLSGDAATVRDAIAAACRRCALGSLALAAAAYRPQSYDDALAIRTLVAEALDVEITASGDAGEDDIYLGLKTLRTSVIADLTARGASLPLVETVTLPTNLPSLVVAYRLYQDASRSDQVAAETKVIHPAFMPLTMRVLAS